MGYELKFKEDAKKERENRLDIVGSNFRKTQ